MPLEKLGTAKALRLICKACELVAIAAPQCTPRCSTPHTSPPRIKIQITCPLSLIKMKYIRGSLNMVAWQIMLCLAREKNATSAQSKSSSHFRCKGFFCFREKNVCLETRRAWTLKLLQPLRVQCEVRSAPTATRRKIIFLWDFQICFLLSF